MNIEKIQKKKKQGQTHMTCGSWHDLQHGSSRLDSGLDENGPVAATIATAASNTRPGRGLCDTVAHAPRGAESKRPPAQSVLATHRAPRLSKLLQQ